MATYSNQRRRGLPRTPGGEPWPPAGEAPESVQASSSGQAFSNTAAATPAQAADVKESAQVALRRGLPRTPGGDPWPPAGEATIHAAATTPAATSVAAPTREVLGKSETPLRRGLPRTPGGEPWPPEGFAPLLAEPQASTPAPEAAESTPAEPAPATVQESPAAAPTPEAEQAKPAVPEPKPAAESTDAAARPAQAPASVATKPAPQPATQEKKEKPPREPIMIGSRSLGQWSKLVSLIVVGGILAAGILVLAARGLTTLPGVPEFMERYTGVYEIPDVAEEGLPWWVRWTHYMNFFFMLLIIRTGLLVRTQQKPDAFYTPKKGGKKVSIYLWLHTSLDILWMLNGLIFVVTLFATGHWRRIVPTSWEVFPNALSSMLQYMTLEWPTYEDGWVYYNSLQELMYFTIVFIAAPLAIITGLRMSEWWPKDAEKLNKIYPAPVARAIHFPVMLFFVLFVIMHVVMVFATGALKNLNHMFYGASEPSWMGFWFFAGGLVLAVGAVVAARPLVIAPIASLFGKVSNR